MRDYFEGNRLNHTMAAAKWRLDAIVKRLVYAGARRLNLDVLPRDVYSPIPDVPPIDDPIWRRPGATPGLTIDPVSTLDYVRSCLAPYVAEFSAPLEHPDTDGFYLCNPWYGAVDAELLYAMVRHHKPQRLLEFGTGYSTLVSARACSANARDGHPVEFVSVDPAPRFIRDSAASVVRFEHVSARSLPLERFLELGAGDILFIDTSHAVKLGSEVNFLILEVLPILRPGVLVHFHDIFLPYEYPYDWLARQSYLSEQYLLQAFLSGNPAYEVVLATHAIARADRQALARILPTVATVRYGPAAFWIRRCLDVASFPDCRTMRPDRTSDIRRNGRQ
jgi:predicted O-methyltransferase YrrM